MMARSPRSASRAGITFHHPISFWAGTAAISAGVILHLPDYLGAGAMGYHMAGMPRGGPMILGMVLIVSGMAMAAFGLIPWRSTVDAGAVTPLTGVHVRAMDSAGLSRAHMGLLFVLGVALIVDVMKPATLGFVIPGMRAEYGLSRGEVVALPIAALAGTTLGSFLWGILADRVGRRASILLASLMFIGTAICGFMPSFGWNLFMCFVMGTSAGGMLPIVYALMAESIPARKRGWLVVLHGGLATVGGYLVASGLAALLEPHFAWRILWFAGLPTGLLVIVLNRWIPESPRFLLERGRIAEAEAVMARYGAVLERGGPVEVLPPPAVGAPPATPRGLRLFRLFRAPYLPQTLTVGSYGLGWGLANWGFITFIPSILQERGVPVGDASRILFLSAVLAIPGTLLVSWLYGMWSTKKSMIAFALVTALSLVGFAVVDPGASGQESLWLGPLMVILLIGSGGVISMLSPYTAEVYPTDLRGTGSGFAAGSSKVGGVFGPPLMAAVVAAVPGFGVLGLLVAAPLVASAVMLAVKGLETRDVGLEEVTRRNALPST